MNPQMAAQHLSKWLRYNNLGEICRHVDGLTKTDLVSLADDDLDRLCKEMSNVSLAKKLKFKTMIRKLKSDHEKNQQLKIKLVFLGDAAVGKTSIIHRYIKNDFDSRSRATIGMDFQKIQHTVSDGNKVNLEIWDTAGQDRFDSVNNGYLKNADCIVIVYDIMKQETFDSIDKRFKARIDENAAKNPYIMIIGNKHDLIIKDGNNGMRAVPREMALQLAQRHNWGFEEASAKSGHQINTLFNCCAEYAYNRGYLVDGTSNVDIAQAHEKEKNGPCCT